MMMPLHPTWQDVAIRLALTVVAGAIIGFNRSVRGHAAGLRTTILVGLAAAVAMIQANILLSVGGKTSDSFGVMDLMRLPLGILTGVGFIGGGAILRRGDLVTGVTTAATLWVMTVIGLCFGGGQLGLGAAATLLAVVTIWALWWVDIRIPRERRAMLAIMSESATVAAPEINGLIAPLGYAARFRRESRGSDQRRTVWFEISWTRPERTGPPLELLALLDQHFAVASFELTPEARH
ncbi:MAG TPA: MgtC/SapB family protein [Acetobacteraceae bacterium]|nr:MgtC/SapB family protein [Acetobacteraceae bacterium]